MGNHWVGRRPSRVSGEETDRSRRKERRGWGKGRGKGGEGVEIEEWGMGEIRDQDQGVGERMGHYGYKSQGFEVGGGALLLWNLEEMPTERIPPLFFKLMTPKTPKWRKSKLT